MTAVAVLVKQVPAVADIPVRSDGRLHRETAAAELNPHCRRALAKGIELARQLDTSCTVLTLGPPRAESVLVEALACGADRAFLITDARLAGADTLATARALAAALTVTGPYDLVLTGRNSVDSDTGQVGPQVAELAGMAFVGPAREMHLHGDAVAVRSELDDGWRESEAFFPVVMSCAERLCAPAKMPDPPGAEELRARVQRLTADDLGPGPWGQAGSPTVVESVDALARPRRPAGPGGIAGGQLDRLIEVIGRSAPAEQLAPVAECATAAGPLVAVLAEPGQARLTRELLGGAAGLAAAAGGRVTVIAGDGDPATGGPAGGDAGAWGADEAVVVANGTGEAPLASAVASWCGWRRPAVLLAPGSNWGREVAGRTAARLGAGLVGDAIDVTWDDGLLRCVKAVAGGSQAALIRCTSATAMATVRPGVFPLRPPRKARPIPVLRMAAASIERTYHIERTTEADVAALGAARVVVGVGSGVAAGDYPLVHELCGVLGAQLVATRRVTDAGLLPQHRQVGLTGRSIAPAVYLALGVSGKPNHMIGVRRASFIAAVNTDPSAPVFAAADVGIVADWRDVARELISRVGGGSPGREQVLADGAGHVR